MSLERVKKTIVQLCAKGLWQLNKATDGIMIKKSEAADDILADYLRRLASKLNTRKVLNLHHSEELKSELYLNEDHIVEITNNDDSTIEIIVISTEDVDGKIENDEEKRELEEFLKTQAHLSIQVIFEKRYKGFYDLTHVNYGLHTLDKTISAATMQLQKVL